MRTMEKEPDTSDIPYTNLQQRVKKDTDMQDNGGNLMENDEEISKGDGKKHEPIEVKNRL